MTSGNGIGGNSRGRLTSLVQRIERLEEDKKAVTADLGEVYSEAKNEGFDVKILRKVIRRRAAGSAKVQEEEALIDLYESALAGADVSDLSRPSSGAKASKPEPAETLLEAAIKNAAPIAPEAQTDTEDQAREKGREAALAGQPITANPYGRGPLRVAWDQAWCAATGSDGMEIPADLAPKGDLKPKKPGGK